MHPHYGTSQADLDAASLGVIGPWRLANLMVIINRFIEYHRHQALFGPNPSRTIAKPSTPPNMQLIGVNAML
jgi:hypothetical protein